MFAQILFLICLKGREQISTECLRVHCMREFGKSGTLDGSRNVATHRQHIKIKQIQLRWFVKCKQKSIDDQVCIFISSSYQPHKSIKPVKVFSTNEMHVSACVCVLTCMYARARVCVKSSHISRLPMPELGLKQHLATFKNSK